MPLAALGPPCPRSRWLVALILLEPPTKQTNPKARVAAQATTVATTSFVFLFAVKEKRGGAESNIGNPEILNKETGYGHINNIYD